MKRFLRAEALRTYAGAACPSGPRSHSNREGHENNCWSLLSGIKAIAKKKVNMPGIVDDSVVKNVLQIVIRGYFQSGDQNCAPM